MAASFGSGQTRKAAADRTPQKQCSPGWVGVVSYKRVLRTDHNEGTSEFAKRNFVGAVDAKKMSREVVYEGKIILDGKSDPNIPQYGMTVAGQYMGATQQKGRVSANITETESHYTKSVRRDSCGSSGTREKTCESTRSAKTAASVSGDVNFGVTFQGGSYGFNFRFPETKATKTVSTQSECKNFCQARNNEATNNSESFPVSFSYEPVSVEKQKYDPKNADRLTGSHSETSTDGKTVITITWNLSKCAAPLQIIDLRFEHHRVPNPDEWVAVDPKTGTVDGNRVRIKAVVFNSTASEQSVTVNFKEVKENAELPDGRVTETVGAGESKEVEYIWDTNGYAWNESGKNQSDREIKAEITGDSRNEKIKIIPKPVILAHGLWSNASAWSDWPGYLRTAHSFAWEAFAVGADPSVAKMSTGDHPGNHEPTNTIYQNAQELGKQIKWVREQRNAWHVDVVAHSMGGLISRQYIDTMMQPVFDNKPEVTHLVMLGTPNMGSPCADLVGGLFDLFGAKNMHAMRELRPSVAADFNKRVTQRRGVRFSVLIGVPVPRTCHKNTWGDGVVEIGSAKYNISDSDLAFRDHVSLTGETQFKDFVLPRLALGPKKARSEGGVAWFESVENDRFASYEPDGGRYGFGEYFRPASFGAADAETQNDPLTVKEKSLLKPGEAKEFDIPAGPGGSGVVVIASRFVTATLTDASGKVIGKSDSSPGDTAGLFRAIYADGAPAGQKLKLKLQNIGRGEEQVMIGGFDTEPADTEFSIEAGRPAASGTPLKAKLTAKGSPVAGAKITATIAGRTKGLTLFDDGKHGDGAANDGIYGASIEKLSPGHYLVEAEVTKSTGAASTVRAILNIEK